jgi:hypothetical protein
MRGFAARKTENVYIAERRVDIFRQTANGGCIDRLRVEPQTPLGFSWLRLPYTARESPGGDANARFLMKL